jgi:hypothetical protein
MSHDRRSPGGRASRDFRFKYSHASRVAAAMTDSNKFVTTDEFEAAIIALSTAYAEMARELERHEVFKVKNLSHALLTTADSTYGLKQLILKSLGTSLMMDAADPMEATAFRSGEAVH